MAVVQAYHTQQPPTLDRVNRELVQKTELCSTIHFWSADGVWHRKDRHHGDDAGERKEQHGVSHMVPVHAKRLQIVPELTHLSPGMVPAVTVAAWNLLHKCVCVMSCCLVVTLGYPLPGRSETNPAAWYRCSHIQHSLSWHSKVSSCYRNRRSAFRHSNCTEPASLRRKAPFFQWKEW